MLRKAWCLIGQVALTDQTVARIGHSVGLVEGNIGINIRIMQYLEYYRNYKETFS